MYTKTTLWHPSGSGKILRILSQEEDASILYSWQKERKDNATAPTYIRHFNPATEQDKVVLISKYSAEFVSASLSSDHRAIAFTVWTPSDPGQVKQKHFEVVTESSSRNAKFFSQEIQDACPIKSQGSDSTKDQSDDTGSPCQASLYKTYHRGSYVSYLAQVCPTSWFMKFNTDRKMKQKATFTNYLKLRVNGDIKLSQYNVLLTLHKESIGLYNVVLETSDETSNRAKNHSSQMSNYDAHYCRVFGKPTSEVIINKIIWSQWDSATQRLYYVVPNYKSSKKQKKLTVYPCQFVCIQFFEMLPRHKVVDIEIDLRLSRYALYNKSSLTFHHDLDPTVASHDLNMRICVFNESGSMCLCWQELPSPEYVPERAYTVAVLDKNVVIHHPHQQCDAASHPVNFIMIGHNLVVQLPGSFIHIYDIESISCDQDRMSNGLYHMQLPDSCFPSLCRSSLEYLMPFCELDDVFGSIETTEQSILSESVDSLSVSSISCHANAVVCFDRSTKSFVSMKLDCEEFGRLFSNKVLTTKNKIFLTRQAVLSTRGHHTSSDAKNESSDEILESIMRDPTNPSVTGILSQFLIATTYFELSDNRHNIPPGMFPLFPVSISSSTLNRMICKRDQESETTSYDYINIRETLKLQIEQYVTTVSSSVTWSPVMRSKSEHHMKNHDIKEALWYRSLSACKFGTYTEYDHESIREELIILKESIKYPGCLQQRKASPQCVRLLHRLTKLFEKDFLKKQDMTSSNASLLDIDSEFDVNSLSFLNKSERDQMSENIIVLTNEKLCDHLSAHHHAGLEPAVSALDLSQLSRDYISAQIRAIHHTLTLLLLKSGIEDFDRSLFSPASSREQDLLFSLNQFQLVCHMTCFPLPNGFHTFITCLTFCCLLAKHTFTEPAINEADEQNTTVDIDFLSQNFFDYVDKRLIRLTDEFVARTLEELGDREVFSPIVEEILKRTRNLDEDDLSKFRGLWQWHNPSAKTHLAKAYLKVLYQDCEAQDVPPRSPGGASKTPTKKEQTVPSYLKEKTSSTRHSSGSDPQSLPANDVGFPPWHAFLDFVLKAEMTSSNDIITASRNNDDVHPVTDLIASTSLQHVMGSN